MEVFKSTTRGQYATTANIQPRLQAGLKHRGFTAPQKAELTGSQQSNTIIEAQRREPGSECVCVC